MKSVQNVQQLASDAIRWHLYKYPQQQQNIRYNINKQQQNLMNIRNNNSNFAKKLQKTFQRTKKLKKI